MKIGLAFGSGGAKGAACVGVIRALEEANLPIHCVAGSSMGALVGGFYATGQLDTLESYLRKITWSDVVKQFDPVMMDSGMFKGEKFLKLVEKTMGKLRFKDTILPFVAVATDLKRGKEVHLKSGSLPKAIRASVGIPGIFTVFRHQRKYLVDGGVTNPLPVDVVHQLGADFVIAVDFSLNHQRTRIDKRQFHRRDLLKISSWFKPKYPNMMDVMGASIVLMQKTVTQRNLQLHPADILLSIKDDKVGLFEFHKSKRLITMGYEKTKKIIPKIKKLLMNRDA